MSRHVSYRGVTIDMEALRRENEKATAIGNMKVNAKGDQLGRGNSVAKTADQIARENHKVKSTIVKTGLKGAMPPSPEFPVKKDVAPVPQSTSKKSKTKEVELPSGDILIEDDNGAD